MGMGHEARKTMRAVALSILFVLWGVVIWVVVHQRQIKREIRANDAMPRPVARTNFLLFLGVTVLALSGLLLYIAFG
jgi:hypothetical protein